MVMTPDFLSGNPGSNPGSFTLMNRFGCTRTARSDRTTQAPMFQGWRVGLQIRLAGFDSLGVCWCSGISRSERNRCDKGQERTLLNTSPKVTSRPRRTNRSRSFEGLPTPLGQVAY